MKILCIDTSCDYICISYFKNGCVFNSNIKKHRKNARYIIDTIDQATKRNQLLNINALTFCYGPGSFIGTRLSSSIIQAFSFLHSIPIIKISSIHLYAYKISRQKVFWGKIILLINAINKTKYSCAFFKIHKNISLRLSKDKVKCINSILNLKHNNIILIGEDISIYNFFVKKGLKKENITFIKKSNFITSIILLKICSLINNYSVFFKKNININTSFPLYLN